MLGPSLGTSTILWENAIPALAERYRVVAWDLPGHGASPATRDAFTVADLADAVAAAVRGTGRRPHPLRRGLARRCDRPRAAAAASRASSRLPRSSPRERSSATPTGWHERAAQVRAQSTSVADRPSAQRWFAPDSIAREPELSGRLLHALRDADDESYALCCEALAAYDVRDRLGEIGDAGARALGRVRRGRARGRRRSRSPTACGTGGPSGSPMRPTCRPPSSRRRRHPPAGSSSRRDRKENSMAADPTRRRRPHRR